MTSAARPSNFLHPGLRSPGREADDIGRYMEVRGYLSEGARKGAQWLESQNTVLEEVDQLVELMTVEKEVLNREISKLRDEQKELQEREVIVGDENAKLKLDNINKQSMLAIQEEQGAKITGALKDVMQLTKQQLDESRFQTNELSTRLGMARDSNENLAIMNEELKDKMKKYKCDFSSISATLEIQRGDNQTLTNSLCTMKEQCRKLQVDSKFLHCHGKELEDRLKISEDMILALRGRASSSKKMEERLRDKCSSLERALDTASVQARAAVRVPVQEKTRVELELLKECKKKDEALLNYSSQLTAAQVEQKKQRLQRTKTERLLNAERRKIFSLTRSMEALSMERAVEERTFRDREFEMKELRKKLRKTSGELRLAKRKELQFNIAKQEVETTLCRIEEELRHSRLEMADVKTEMECKEGLWWGEKQAMEQQKLDLIKAHRKEMDRIMQLKFDMEGKDDHVDIIAMEDYRRLKEASAKRCTELAKEVWKLKSDLEELQTKRHHPHKKCPQIYIESHY